MLPHPHLVLTPEYKATVATLLFQQRRLVETTSSLSHYTLNFKSLEVKVMALAIYIEPHLRTQCFNDAKRLIPMLREALGRALREGFHICGQFVF